MITRFVLSDQTAEDIIEEGYAEDDCVFDTIEEAKRDRTSLQEDMTDDNWIDYYIYKITVEEVKE